MEAIATYTLLRSENCNFSNWWQCNYFFYCQNRGDFPSSHTRFHIQTQADLKSYKCSKSFSLNEWDHMMEIKWTAIRPTHTFINPFSCKGSFLSSHTAFNTMSYHLQYTATIITKITRREKGTTHVNIPLGGLNGSLTIH